jgi:hypothetical protein
VNIQRIYWSEGDERMNREAMEDSLKRVGQASVRNGKIFSDHHPHQFGAKVEVFGP